MMPQSQHPHTSDPLLTFVQQHLAGNRSTPITARSRLFEEQILHAMHILALISWVESRLGRRLKAHEITMANFASVEAICRRFFGTAVAPGQNPAPAPHSGRSRNVIDRGDPR